MIYINKTSIKQKTFFFRNQPLYLDEVLYFTVTFNLKQSSHVMLKCTIFHPLYGDILISFSLWNCECSFKDAENKGETRLISLKDHISNILESHQCIFKKTFYMF